MKFSLFGFKVEITVEKIVSKVENSPSLRDIDFCDGMCGCDFPCPDCLEPDVEAKEIPALRKLLEEPSVLERNCQPKVKKPSKTTKGKRKVTKKTKK